MKTRSDQLGTAEAEVVLEVSWELRKYSNMAKTVTEAKELRQIFLLEFEAAVEDLQEIVEAGNGTIRCVKNKLKAVKDAYDEVMRAHAKLVTLEKTPSDETKKE